VHEIDMPRAFGPVSGLAGSRPLRRKVKLRVTVQRLED
jgi:hypothetical protein